jgi:hypothetical protein
MAGSSDEGEEGDEADESDVGDGSDEGRSSWGPFLIFPVLLFRSR